MLVELHLKEVNLFLYLKLALKGITHINIFAKETLDGRPGTNEISSLGRGCGRSDAHFSQCVLEHGVDCGNMKMLPMFLKK